MSEQKTGNPFAMTTDELNTFLSEPQYASVSTLRQDGSPVTIVLGFDWDGKALYLSCRNTRLIVKRLARDPRICVTVFNQTYPPKWVSIQGTAEVVDDPGYEETRRQMLRYMAPDSPTMRDSGLDIDLDEFWKGYTVVGRVFYRVRPRSILSEDAVKWGDHERVAGAGVSDARARQRGDLAPGQGR
jgi:PPOX class probable F420-dependent enzyme